jgi:hypothetical protein
LPFKGTESPLQNYRQQHDSKESGLQPSSALNEVNNQDDDGDYKQEMDQAAANVAKQAEKPENEQNNNYSPEHAWSFSFS